MGITQIIDPYYEKLDSSTYRKEPSLGQICWVPVPHLDRIPRILDVERADPKEHFATRFKIRNMTKNDFIQKTRLPIKALNLRETEELIISKAKVRQAIVVAKEGTIFDDMKIDVGKRSHLQEPNIIVVPMYGVESPEHSGGIPQKMVARVKAMLYRQYFYCLPNSSPLVYESIARLDRIQTVIPIYPTYAPEAIALSKEALGVLLAMLREYFGAPEDGDLEVIRELVAETLPKEFAPREGAH